MPGTQLTSGGLVPLVHANRLSFFSSALPLTGCFGVARYSVRAYSYVHAAGAYSYLYAAVRDTFLVCEPPPSSSRSSTAGNLAHALPLALLGPRAHRTRVEGVPKLAVRTFSCLPAAASINAQATLS